MIEAAIPAFSDSTAADVGIEICASAAPSTSWAKPAPSFPIKIATGSRKSGAGRPPVSASLDAADPAATVALTRAEQAQRDRSDAPQMARAADAVEIDTTALGLDEVIREIVALADRAAPGGRPPQIPPHGAGPGGRPPETPPLRKAGAWST